MLALTLLAASPLLAEPLRLDLAAEQDGTIRRAAPLVELRLKDDATALLDGVIVPQAVAGEAEALLAPLLAAGWIAAAVEPSPDRYGRPRLRAQGADGRLLQDVLLEAGLAVVQPLPGMDDAYLEALLATEALARRAKRGIWRDEGAVVVDSAPARAAERLGQFSLIEGVVLQASGQQRYFYLNFGPDWRADTTARIDRGTLRAMREAGFDPAALEGRRVRVRGTLFAENGPMIELWTHQGIEVLP